MNFDDLSITNPNHFQTNQYYQTDDHQDSHERLKPPDLDDFGLSFMDTAGQKDNHHHVDHIEEEMPNISTFKQQQHEEEDMSNTNVHIQRRTSTRGRRPKKGQSKRSFGTRGRHVIQHNYHDHADDLIDFDEFTSDAMGCDSTLKKKGGVAVPFPLKLHELLEKVEEEGHQHIVSWQPHGRAFVVREPKTFVADLMPRFFRQTKLTSFQRQLNLYGFSRLTRGPDGGGYYHELFLRGKPELTRRMVRTKIKGTGYKAASNPAMEPNFYKMRPLRPVSNCHSNNNGFEQHVGYEMISPESPVTRNHVSMPIVTPEANFPNRSPPPQLQSHEVFPLPDNTSSPPVSEPSVKSANGSKPFLKPRHHHHHSRAVKMGNEYFHYMESFKQPLDDEDYSPDEGTGSRSCTPSPIFFEKISSEDTSMKDTDEDPSQDPLAIFLADMEGEFEDDMVFTSPENNSTQESSSNGVEPQNDESSSNLYVFEV